MINKIKHLIFITAIISIKLGIAAQCNDHIFNIFEALTNTSEESSKAELLKNFELHIKQGIDINFNEKNILTIINNFNDDHLKMFCIIDSHKDTITHLLGNFTSLFKHLIKTIVEYYIVFPTELDFVRYRTELGETNNYDLFYAVQQNDIDKAKQSLVNVPLGINAHYFTGSKNGHQTPLTEAINMGNLEMAKLLLNAKAHIELTDTFGYSPLVLAVTNNNLNIVKFLIDNKANINSRNQSSTVMQMAILYNNFQAINYLITQGVNFNDLGVNKEYYIYTFISSLSELMAKEQECRYEKELTEKANEAIKNRELWFITFLHLLKSGADINIDHNKLISNLNVRYFQFDDIREEKFKKIAELVEQYKLILYENMSNFVSLPKPIINIIIEYNYHLPKEWLK